MFGLQGFVDCLRRRREASCRLIPITWDFLPTERSEEASLTATVPAVIGRSSAADVRLHDPWVSRIHCELLPQDGAVIICDLDSRHGVYVNGERVSQQTLHTGDELLLGVSRFRVEIEESVSADDTIPAEVACEA